ncbi:Flp family type IVb pilin [Clostridium grantii]|uniref:Pilus assembly protein Flp/PilA n=1 Tax=Clostridium grantii DSM 8605 TaxID=1121316 RepID=A0A1M5XB51_9CLOT|nr:Flp family type IVb pilin [Clostridium grantii]SHH97050.1 pilus assembly protein Flp/PilA [Clostridium grantii DSM 8605]
MLNYLKTYVRCLPKTKKGQAMVEYALIIGLIAVVLIAVVTSLGTGIKGKFNSIVTGLGGTAVE